MFAIAFDLVVSETERHHPKSISQAYADIGKVLASHNFQWRQGSVHTSDGDDLANLSTAIQALKALPWFPACVRDNRTFRVEQWSDFTGIIKS